MKRVLKSLCIAIFILAVAIGLGAIGIVKDQQLFVAREGEVLGHGMPVYTMIYPMLWLAFLIVFSAVRSVGRFFRRIANNRR